MACGCGHTAANFSMGIAGAGFDCTRERGGIDRFWHHIQEPERCIVARQQDFGAAVMTSRRFSAASALTTLSSSSVSTPVSNSFFSGMSTTPAVLQTATRISGAAEPRVYIENIPGKRCGASMHDPVFLWCGAGWGGNRRGLYRTGVWQGRDSELQQEVDQQSHGKG